MSFVCVPQVKALTRSEPVSRKADGRAPRHSAQGGKILAEMGEERYSSSDTLNCDLTGLNEYYQDETSGLKVWNEMCEYVDQHPQIVRCKEKDADGNPTGKIVVHERQLRKDAVIGVATIIKPPAEEIESWDEEKKSKFFIDADAALREYDKEIYGMNNETFGVLHNDEAGVHKHQVNLTVDAKGHCFGSKVETVKWLNGLTVSFCKSMRERGWDIEMPDLTDFDRMKTDSEYARSRREKWKRSGMSERDYVEAKAKEKMKEADGILQKAMEIQKDAEIMKSEAEKQIADEREKLEDDRKEQEKKIAEEWSKLNNAQRIRSERSGQADNYLRSTVQAVQENADRQNRRLPGEEKE